MFRLLLLSLLIAVTPRLLLAQSSGDTGSNGAVEIHGRGSSEDTTKQSSRTPGVRSRPDLAVVSTADTASPAALYSQSYKRFTFAAYLLPFAFSYVGWGAMFRWETARPVLNASVGARLALSKDPVQPGDIGGLLYGLDAGGSWRIPITDGEFVPGAHFVGDYIATRQFRTLSSGFGQTNSYISDAAGWRFMYNIGGELRLGRTSPRTVIGLYGLGDFGALFTPELYVGLMW